MALQEFRSQEIVEAVTPSDCTCTAAECSSSECITSECTPSECSTPITLTSRVKLYPYLCRKEGEEYIVGRPELSVYVSVPPIGVDAMRLLEQGLSVSEVSARLQEDDDVPSDIADFVQTLMEYGLVAEIDGQPVIVEVSEQERRSGGIEVLRRLRGKHVRWLFGTPALIISALLLVVSGIVLFRYPPLLPTSDNFFVLPWYAVNILLMMATSFALIFVHELGHLSAARTMGIDGRLSVSRRLYTLVAQCTIGDMWQLPRHKRLIIYSAGMLVNLWIFFLAMVLLVGAGNALPPVVAAWLKLVLIIEWAGTGWQFLFYMKTDVYYIVSDLFHARNLMEDAESSMRHLLIRLFPRLSTLLGSGDLSHVPIRERRFVQVYAVFYVLGVGIALGLFVAYLLPFVVRSNLGSLVYLSQGARAGWPHLADAVVTLVTFGFSYGLLAWLWWRDWRGRLVHFLQWIRTRKETKTA